MKLKFKKFKRRELSIDAFRVLMFDLGCLWSDDEDKIVHYDLIKKNLEDIFGKKIVNDYKKKNYKL